MGWDYKTLLSDAVNGALTGGGAFAASQIIAERNADRAREKLRGPRQRRETLYYMGQEVHTHGSQRSYTDREVQMAESVQSLQREVERLRRENQQLQYRGPVKEKVVEKIVYRDRPAKQNTEQMDRMEFKLEKMMIALKDSGAVNVSGDIKEIKKLLKKLVTRMSKVSEGQLTTQELLESLREEVECMDLAVIEGQGDGGFSTTLEVIMTLINLATNFL